jgi:hypothetical protein
VSLLPGPALPPLLRIVNGLPLCQYGDGIDLPSCERLFRNTCPALAILKLVVQRKRKAILDIVLCNPILDPPKPGWWNLVPVMSRWAIRKYIGHRRKGFARCGPAGE